MRTLLPVIALSLAGLGAASAQEVIPISGYEIFPGVGSDDTRIGVTFAGWTAPDAAVWHSTSEQTGGFWAANLTRIGSAGIGGRVIVLSGRWLMQTPSGSRFVGDAACSAALENCAADWPGTIDSDIGCGPGVGRFHIELAIRQLDGQGSGTGTVDGCLDDTHLTTVIPPTAWGTIMINAVPPAGAAGER